MAKKDTIEFQGNEVKPMADGKIAIFYQGSNDFVIPKYTAMRSKTNSEARTIDQAVIINGGANVAFGGTHKTQRDVKYGVTHLTAEEFEIVKNSPQFIRKHTRGFITFAEPQKLQADKSAQLTKEQVAKKSPGVEVKTGEAVKG